MEWMGMNYEYSNKINFFLYEMEYSQMGINIPFHDRDLGLRTNNSVANK